jgi:uncharacterized cupredoxin-like copper-binding protein
VKSGGQPFPGLYGYGSSTVAQPAPDKTATGPFDAGATLACAEIGTGSHTIVFTISPDAPTEGQTETSESVNPNGTPYVQSFYNGPWVVAEGQATSSVYSSAQAFAITAGKYLTPRITHNTLPASFINTGNLKEDEVVKITNSLSIKDKLDKTIIYASLDGKVDGEAYPLGEVDKKVTLEPGKSTTITVSLSSYEFGQLDGPYQLVAAVYDTAGLPGLTTDGPSITVAQPVVDLVPSAVRIASTSTGGDTFHFTVTNTGNVKSTQPAGLEFSYFPKNFNGIVDYLGYKSETLNLDPGKSTRVKLTLTAARVRDLKDGPPAHLIVTASEYESNSVPIEL